MEKTILLIRHGETDWNKCGRIQGWKDISLNKQGLMGADRLSEYIAENYPEIDAFYSSDLKRAIQTANPTTKKYNANLIQIKALREQCFGTLEGKTFDELSYEEKIIFKKIKIDKDETYQPTDNAENYPTFKNRIINECERIFYKEDENIQAIITHGGVIKVINTEILGREDIGGFYSIKNNSLTIIKIDKNKNIKLEGFNQYHFLKP